MIITQDEYTYTLDRGEGGQTMGKWFIDFTPRYYAIRSDGARTVKQDYTTPEGVIRAIKKGTAKFVKEATNE